MVGLCWIRIPCKQRQAGMRPPLETAGCADSARLSERGVGGVGCTSVAIDVPTFGLLQRSSTGLFPTPQTFSQRTPHASQVNCAARRPHDNVERLV